MDDKKFRYKTWWWGRWVKRTKAGGWIDDLGTTFDSPAFSEKEMEPYIEEKHGLEAQTRWEERYL